MDTNAKWDGVERRSRKRFGSIDRIFTVTYNTMRKTTPELVSDFTTEPSSSSNYMQVVENEGLKSGQNVASACIL